MESEKNLVQKDGLESVHNHEYDEAESKGIYWSFYRFWDGLNEYTLKKSYLRKN